MSGGFASVDGMVCAVEQATLSVLDRAVLYGDSAFEVLRTYDGRPHALDLHVSRLLQSCAILGIDASMSRAVLAREVLEVLACRGAGESFVRLEVTRGLSRHGLDPFEAGPARRIVTALPLQAPSSALYEQGVAAITVTASGAARLGPLAGAKHGNYLAHALATRQARAVGAHEALLLDERGDLLEGASSNVFVVTAGSITTPASGQGILAGITRGLVLQLARRAGLVTHEIVIPVGALYRADEVWISSSVRELVPVCTIDGRAVGNAMPGPLGARLLALYREGIPGRTLDPTVALR